jgi:hypothetical protein
MSSAWFIIKSLFITFGIVSLLQVEVGKDNKTLESYFISWMKSLAASKRILSIANGGKELTTDVIRELTTPDGGLIIIHEKKSADGSGRQTKEKTKFTKNNKEEDSVDSGLISSRSISSYSANLMQKIVGGLNIGISDLSIENQKSIKEQIRKELEEQVHKDYEKKLKKAGIDPKTLESKVN